MTLQEIVEDIVTLGDSLRGYERKYSILSETFYESYQNGEEPEDDDWVGDWAIWAGTYETWQERKTQYRRILDSLTRQTPQLSGIIGKAARRESILVPA